jgi:hypothetical protein
MKKSIIAYWSLAIGVGIGWLPLFGGFLLYNMFGFHALVVIEWISRALVGLAFPSLPFFYLVEHRDLKISWLWGLGIGVAYCASSIWISLRPVNSIGWNFGQFQTAASILMLAWMGALLRSRMKIKSRSPLNAVSMTKSLIVYAAFLLTLLYAYLLKAESYMEDTSPLLAMLIAFPQPALLYFYFTETRGKNASWCVGLILGVCYAAIGSFLPLLLILTAGVVLLMGPLVLSCICIPADSVFAFKMTNSTLTGCVLAACVVINLAAPSSLPEPFFNVLAIVMAFVMQSSLFFYFAESRGNKAPWYWGLLAGLPYAIFYPLSTLGTNTEDGAV